MRGRNLRRTLVAAGLVAASAVLVLVLAGGGARALFCVSFTHLPPPTKSKGENWCGAGTVK